MVNYVNFVNYIIYIMEKNKIKSTENSQKITNQQEQSEHQSRGVYLRDDHCDWGSSGMNEFTEEFTLDS